ncbi:myeloperoxidase-like [Branchiostoma floridae x Branchiostoma japonicum]
MRLVLSLVILCLAGAASTESVQDVPSEVLQAIREMDQVQHPPQGEDNTIDPVPNRETIQASREVEINKLLETINQAAAGMTHEAASRADQTTEETSYTGALRALAYVQRPTPMAVELSRCAAVLEHWAKYLMDNYTVEDISAIDSPQVTSVCDHTSMEPITCPAPAVPEFRSADGRCNNRDHPLWGSTEQPFTRLLDPVYDDDLMTPRATSCDGTPLPSARLVSTTVHQDLRTSSPVNTHMVMQWGQFLDHDVTLTPSFAEEGLACTCDSADEHCFNIPVPSDDPDFSARPCLEFARSRSCPNEGCHMGRRQQLNQITAFVDASNVYGSSEEEIENLRDRGEPSRGVNLALGRPTAQLSTSHGGLARRAVDGNTDGDFHSGSCTHTNRPGNRRPWWRVDLGTAQAIGNVVVFNRQDCCSERLNNFQVHVGDSPRVAFNPQCGGNHAVTGGLAEITVDCGGLTGRYVGILLPSSQYLSLCEVQVYAAPPPTSVQGRGLLKSRPNPADANKKELLPGNTEEEDFLCDDFTGNMTCSQAGDIRVNEQPGLTSMHTVFLREHNRIARWLSGLNPHWDDDRVFYETRKIVGALMQQVTYGEFLPHVLGPAAMARFHLTLAQSGFFSGYEPHVNPTISNVFATAAYRFGHSLVQNVLDRYDPDFTQGNRCPFKLAFGFFNPSQIFDDAQGGPDSILRGLTAQPHQDFDRFMVSGLTKRLFADPPGSDRGLDLASLNIQRGRDHGLPGYNAWRGRCGLPRADSVCDLESEIPDYFTRKRLENLYSHVDDIDLFVGGLAEESVPGGVVGPTFACLIGLQFQDLRKGDRFWFENPGQFTEAQLAEIRKTSLARILCDNTDGTTRLQPDVFLQHTQSGNERVACSSLPQMDLTKWQE